MDYSHTMMSRHYCTITHNMMGREGRGGRGGEGRELTYPISSFPDAFSASLTRLSPYSLSILTLRGNTVRIGLNPGGNIMWILNTHKKEGSDCMVCVWEFFVPIENMLLRLISNVLLSLSS